MIPLAEKQGWLWDIVRALLAWVTATKVYQQLRDVICGYLEKIKKTCCSKSHP
jgi:hypothetical protein